MKKPLDIGPARSDTSSKYHVTVKKGVMNRDSRIQCLLRDKAPEHMPAVQIHENLSMMR